ncbi:RagB/SusD family nutrient uptake outer membrane protein [Chryseobacterium sp. Ch-15]|uniref:RagB/SusD family nutrient uptake outer membrane protein n=1 Tax=Chryseobacterium muglaense TaxID=2893752 RepID=A0A9Q3UWA9_9FLAO|nr:RagB/SusD family nutrient uptake outer membrane protein [Chryseobacterium muglaense]MBD3905347.1 RagB/SusD family nutrient uptake outer membrane protein [Chryseobacterium muglaense]MCC9036928.1 RagB/SusD family nutrient uptake outer membrane protein [Chryseobacterium muglaense]MCM2555210.1 RagB/SusD family nutrient uptake outer membrane protein [Chryseobacterium muglaense]
MKKIFLTISILSLFVSCNDDFVDIKPEGVVVAEDFYKTEADAMKATNAIYSFLRSWENSGFPAQFVYGVTGDDVEKGSNPGDASFINAYDNFSFTTSDDGVNGYWTGQWQAVQRANQVITNVPNIDMDSALKTRLVAEAKMLRAYFYFNLVRIYGGVPIFDGIQADYINQPRNTAAEVYAFIVKDLTEASTILPQTYPAGQEGRVTKGGALGLLSKVYLYMKDYQKAYDVSNQVKGMGYSLDSSFNHLFRPAGEFGTESVFEVNCGCSPEFGGSQYAEVQGVRNQYGWGFFTPTQALENAFEPGDIRKQFTILREGQITPEGDLIKKGDPQAGNTWNYKTYVPSSLNNNACGYGSIQNIRILRFADILLINAEAANELGNTAVAITNINLVRNRAQLANTTATNQLALRTAIWQERRVELAMENDRFPDLVRTGQAGTFLGPLGFQTGKNELFPIPLRAITDSKGILTQNPGY